MLVVSNNDPGRRGTRADIEKLKECNDVTTFSECGYFCVLGYQDDKRLVNIWFDTEEEYTNMRYPERLSARDIAMGYHLRRG